MNHDAARRDDRQRACVGNTVIRADKFNAKISFHDHLAVLYHLQIRRSREIKILQLFLDKRQRQLCTVNRDVEFFQKIWKSADMILVPVRQYNRTKLVFVLHNIGKIRYDGVDAGHVVLRECYAAVDKNHVVIRLKNRQVFANFANSA